MFHDSVSQFLAAFSVDRRDREVAIEIGEFFQEGGYFFIAIGQQVQLVQHQPARFFIQRGVVFFQFVENGVRVGGRVDFLIRRRNVDQMQQQAGARQMAQELVSQPRTFRRTLDQAGDVGDDEAHATRVPHPNWGAAW